MNDTGRYILEGTTPVPCDDLMEWARWMETAKRHVSDETYCDVRVSTVFLGLDHNFDGKGPPVLFETLVFGGELNDEMDRCSTYEEAIAQHIRMFKRVVAAKDDYKVSPQHPQPQGESP